MVEKPEDVIMQGIDEQLELFIDRVFELSQDNLNTPHEKTFKSGESKDVITTDTGILAGSGNVSRREFLDKEINYSAPYAEDIEMGTTSSSASAKSLEKWVRRKVFANRASDAAVKRTAKNIAKALAERGISADPYLVPAIDQTVTEFKKRGIIK